MNSFKHALSRTDAQPIHTVKARWGSRPVGRWKGYEPDWHVVTIRQTGDAEFPFLVEGWLPSTSRSWGGPADGPAGEFFIWRTNGLDDPRYDLTEAVFLPGKF